MDVLQSKVIQNVKLELSKLRPTIWLEKLNQIKEELNTLTEKIKDYRDRLTFELLTSEHSYVLFLTTLLHVFKIPITKYQKDIGIDDNEVLILFPNLEEIIQCHNEFLDDLVNCFRNWSPSTMLSFHLKRAVQAVKTYKNYAVHFDKANSLLVDLSKKTVTKNIFSVLEEDPLCKGLTLPALLIMPIQRIPRYVLFLSEIVEHTPQNHPDYIMLTEVRDELKIVAEEFNRTLQSQEEIESTKKIIKQFDKIKEHKLMKPGRLFLYQGELALSKKSEKLSNDYYFLFSDILVISVKLSNNKWGINQKYSWSFLTTSDDTSSPVSFKVTTDNYEANLTANSIEEKQAWMNAFSKVGISNENLAHAMAPLRLAATKECLICLKSFNQLRKRYYCRNCGWVICRLCGKGTQKRKLCDYCFGDFDQSTISRKGLPTNGCDLMDSLDNTEDGSEDISDSQGEDKIKNKIVTQTRGISKFNMRISNDSDKENSIPASASRILSNSYEPKSELKLPDSRIIKKKPEFAKEILVYRKIISFIYLNDGEMGRMRGINVPTAVNDLWQSLSSSDLTLILNNNYIPDIIAAIQTSATKQKMISLNASCYWLSTVCAICSLITEQTDPGLKQLEETFNQLFFTIFKYLLDKFKSEVKSQLVSAFLNSNDSSNCKVKGWEFADFIQYLSEYVKPLTNYNAPKRCLQSLVRLFMAHVNQILFNHLIVTKSACTAANGFKIKLNLSLLEEWLNSKNLRQNSISRLKRIMEAATLISLDRHSINTDGTIVTSACPTLTVGQIKQLLENTRFDTSFGQSNPTFFDWVHHLATTSGVTQSESCIGELIINQQRSVSKVFPYWQDSILSVTKQLILN